MILDERLLIWSRVWSLSDRQCEQHALMQSQLGGDVVELQDATLFAVFAGPDCANFSGGT